MTSSNESLIVDNDLALFGRDQLLNSLAKVTNKKYPSLKYTEYLPIDYYPENEWDKEFEVVEFDAYGIATVLADSANDGGLVGVVARRTRYPIKTLSDYTLVPWAHLQQCRKKGVNIDAKYAAALFSGMERKHNAIAYDGDVDYGLQGIFTSQLPRMNAATTFAGAANPRARIDILNNAVSTVMQNTQGVWVPRVIAMPSRQHQLLSNEIYIDVSGKTVMTVFKENQAELKQIVEVISDDTLIGKGDGGTDAMLVLPGNDPTMQGEFHQPSGDDDDLGGHVDAPMYYAIMKDFEVPEEFMQWQDTMYRERAISRVAGFVAEDPRAGLIVSGI
jgi:hypothetical protein